MGAYMDRVSVVARGKNVPFYIHKVRYRSDTLLSGEGVPFCMVCIQNKNDTIAGAALAAQRVLSSDSLFDIIMK